MVYVYPSSNKQRCPVALYKNYTGLRPVGKSCKKLYLRPKPKPKPNCWYSDQPYGINKVLKTVRDLCNKAGLDGKFSNHSLRATSASRMYSRNVPEQYIKEVMGHKSDCVQVYKCTPDQLRQFASSTISDSVESEASYSSNLPI